MNHNSHPYNHMPYHDFDYHLKGALRKRGFKITQEWWDKQVNNAGHRSLMYYDMGLTIEAAADEMQPFCDAQLTGKPRYKSETWKDCCIGIERA